jgi:hypothetical protein
VALVEEFRSAVIEIWRGRADGHELLPTVLAQATVQVLPVAGAGFSVTRSLRVPLGAADKFSAAAERLQTTLGEGPCLAATDQAEPLVVDLADMASRWPVFHLELTQQTPFRSVASLPLSWGDPLQRLGALDLYLTAHDPPPAHLINGANDVADTAAEMLFASPPLIERNGTTYPVWMTGASATQRMRVWLAVGLLTGHAGLSSTDALAVLRAYAYGNRLTLDDVAEAVTIRQLDPETLLGGA